MKDLLDRYSNFRRIDADGRHWTTSTQRIVVEYGAGARAAELLKRWVHSGLVLLLQDRNTALVAGDEVAHSLRSAGAHLEVITLQPDEGHEDLRCDDPTIDDFERIVRAHGPAHVIAVGAGTLNDIAKMACHRVSVPYSCVATAPSMNGYTSAIAAILSAGVKTTQPCTPPVAVLADPLVMAAAPYRMIASGIGDLYSKPVSNADWRLSHRLLGTEHSAIVMEIVEAGSALLDGVAPRLPARDPDAVAALTAALMLSGLAMQAAGSSATASGGEHLVSHYIDMTSVAFDLPHDFHGCQVACGTIATSALYEHVRSMDPSTIDIDGLVARWPDLAQVEAIVHERFGILAPSVLPYARQNHVDATELRRRLTLLVEQWDSIMEDCGHTLRPTTELQAELDSADCPTQFPQLPVDRERAYAAFAWSRFIRARYTILHLAAELGVMDSFARSFVDAQYDRSRS
jgi:glycerol-1-phosphate dehydrogenase [NAD(P)+]